MERGLSRLSRLFFTREEEGEDDDVVVVGVEETLDRWTETGRTFFPSLPLIFTEENVNEGEALTFDELADFKILSFILWIMVSSSGLFRVIVDEQGP
jgi:hypothetical protein